MNPRGVTLVELLAVISILVVVTALSLPAVEGRLGAARLEAGQGQIEAAVLATRAEAVRVGRPLSLVARAGVEGTELVVRAMEESPLDSSASAGEERKSESGRSGGGARTRPSGSVWCTLPAGLKISDSPSAVVEERAALKASPAHESLREEKTVTASEVQIAVFCPDGTAVASAAAYLSDGKADWTISVNHWVGGARFDPYVAEGRDENAETAVKK